MMVIGLAGYLLLRARIPVAPILLGLVLGPTLERESRTALIMSEGHLSIFYSSLPALLFFGLALLVIGAHVVGNLRARSRAFAASRRRRLIFSRRKICRRQVSASWRRPSTGIFGGFSGRSGPHTRL